MPSKCTKCGNTENYNFALNIGLCNPCIGGRITELEAALQGMVPFIEDDFPRGTGKNHGTCATDEYQQACDAVIKALNS